MSFGKLKAGQVSDYAAVDATYADPAVEIHIGEKKLEWTPGCYEGDELLKTGSFTYALTAHPEAEEYAQITFLFTKDQDKAQK